MQKITTCLWFNDNVEEAVNFYTSLFEGSKVKGITHYGEAGAKASGRTIGSVMTVLFQLAGQEFLALNGGPLFTFTPAISFFVSCKSEAEINHLYKSLSKDGSVLVELDKYPFSEKFAWINDKYGVSWQLSLTERAQKITPSLMFVGEQCGKAQEALNFYVSQFQNSSIDYIERYRADERGVEGTVKHAAFSLEGQDFMCMDSNQDHAFTFTLATSFIVNCCTQEEIDEFWEKLSNGGKTSHCGWLQDKYGLSWQIVPTVLGEMMQGKDPEKSYRVMEAVLKMEKLDIKVLEQANVQ